jgi:hypothetical protein
VKAETSRATAVKRAAGVFMGWIEPNHDYGGREPESGCRAREAEFETSRKSCRG